MRQVRRALRSTSSDEDKPSIAAWSRTSRIAPRLGTQRTIATAELNQESRPETKHFTRNADQMRPAEAGIVSLAARTANNRARSTPNQFGQKPQRFEEKSDNAPVARQSEQKCEHLRD